MRRIRSQKRWVEDYKILYLQLLPGCPIHSIDSNCTNYCTPLNNGSNFQKFKDDYTRKFSFIKQSKISEFHAYCGYCRCDLLLKHGGINNGNDHVKTMKHERNARAAQDNRSINLFFRPDSETDVLKAETLFTNFILEDLTYRRCRSCRFTGESCLS